MKNMKGMTLKTMLVIALLAAPTFADGDMGGGGLAGTETGVCTKVESTSNLDGDMGGGGFTGDMGGGGFCSSGEETSLMDAIFGGVYEFFDLIG